MRGIADAFTTQQLRSILQLSTNCSSCSNRPQPLLDLQPSHLILTNRNWNPQMPLHHYPPATHKVRDIVDGPQVCFHLPCVLLCHHHHVQKHSCLVWSTESPVADATHRSIQAWSRQAGGHRQGERGDPADEGRECKGLFYPY
jgi:hypothetical protein